MFDYIVPLKMNKIDAAGPGISSFLFHSSSLSNMASKLPKMQFDHREVGRERLQRSDKLPPECIYCNVARRWLSRCENLPYHSKGWNINPEMCHTLNVPPLVSSHRQLCLQSLAANGPRWPTEKVPDAVKPKQTSCPTPLSAGFNQTALSVTLQRVYIWLPLGCCNSRGWFITAGITATLAANSQTLCGSRLPGTWSRCLLTEDE